jgi:predicted methyltransferase
MSDLYFKLMVCIYMVADPFYSPEERIKSFGISKGKTVIDYGCGPGRYLKGFSDAVGTKGRSTAQISTVLQYCILVDGSSNMAWEMSNWY